LAKGAPDYTRKVILTEAENLFGKVIQVGDSELAARLESPVTYERRGNVYMFDSFEYGLIKVQTSAIGTGASVATDSTAARTGQYSAKLTAGSDSLRKAAITYKIPAIISSKPIGIEFAWNINSDVDYLSVLIYIADGTTLKTAGIRYVRSAKRFDYYDTSGAWTTTGITYQIDLEPPPFYPLKLVLDHTNNKYLRMYFGPTEHDLSSFSFGGTASGAAPLVTVEIAVYSDVAVNGIAWVDDFIFTVNEPTE